MCVREGEVPCIARCVGGARGEVCEHGFCGRCSGDVGGCALLDCGPEGKGEEGEEDEGGGELHCGGGGGKDVGIYRRLRVDDESLYKCP